MSRWINGIEQSKQYIEQIKDILSEKYPLENADNSIKWKLLEQEKQLILYLSA